MTSSVFWYGRPSMMACAFFSPIPGSATSCSLGAVLRLTGPMGAAGLAACFACAGAFGAAGVAAGALDAGAPVAAPAAAGAWAAGGPPTVTSGLIFSSFDLPSPLTLARSSTLLYGRPWIIAFAVAGPTPGSDSMAFWSAVLMSMGPAANALPAVKARATAATTANTAPMRYGFPAGIFPISPSFALEFTPFHSTIYVNIVKCNQLRTALKYLCPGGDHGVPR